MKKEKLVFVALLLMLAVAIFFSLISGEVKGWNREVVLNLRLPRMLLGLIAGTALAASGSVYQGLLRNPLADPYILGVSSAGTLGAMIAIILDFHLSFTLYLFSIGTSFLSMLIVYRIALTHGRAPVQTLILAGVISSTFFGALVLLCFTIFRRESFSLLFFVLGSLSNGAPVTLLIISGILVTIGLLFSLFFARDLDAMSSGDENAHHLGIPVERVKKLLFFTSSLLVGSSVALVGSIGFVGLIIPHLLRFLIGPSHRRLIFASALGGSAFLILMDLFARTAFSPVEVPVGVFTSLCGAPFFVYLLKRRQRTSFL